MDPASLSTRPRIFVDSVESLESAYHSLIPISRHMGISVVSYDGNALTISAPLAPNINHQQSAFGGSLFSVAALAGWGLMQMKLSELLLDCNTVVSGGEVSFQRPVYEDLRCTCTLPEDAEQLFGQLASSGAVSMNLASQFLSSGKPAMTLNGRFHLKKRSSPA